MRDETFAMHAVSTQRYWGGSLASLTQDIAGLYYKLHGRFRPVEMKKSFIKRRKRIAPAIPDQSQRPLPTPGTSASPDPSLAPLPERHRNNASHIDPHLHHDDHHAGPQHPITEARGPPPVDFTTYAARATPSSTPFHRTDYTEYSQGRESAVHAQKRSFIDSEPGPPLDRLKRRTPEIGNGGTSHETKAPPADSGTEQAKGDMTHLSEEERNAKRKRKRELEEKIRLMQLEMQQLEQESGDG